MSYMEPLLKLLEDSEGFRSKAYPDPASGGDPWTIGFGTTRINGEPVMPGMTCTREEATAWVQSDVADLVSGVRRLVKVPLNDNRLAALVDFSYNLGIKALANSTLLHLLNLGKYNDAANEFGKWIRAAGKVMPGLVKRRQAEKVLFLKSGS